jgi:hypothetical protein
MTRCTLRTGIYKTSMTASRSMKLIGISAGRKNESSRIKIICRTSYPNSRDATDKRSWMVTTSLQSHHLSLRSRDTSLN